MTQFKAFVFDLDGVLVDSEPLHYSTWLQAFEAMEMDFPAGRHDVLQGRRAEQVVEWFERERPQAIAGVDVERLVVLKRQYFRERMGELTAIRGADAFLRSHKGHRPLGLVTSAGLKTVGQLMLLFKWRNIFDALIGAEHVTRAKPDPECFVKAVQRFRIRPEECLVFEDSPVGIEAARSAGCAVCGVASQLSARELRSAGAQWTIRDFTDAAGLDRALTARRGGLAGLMQRLAR